MRKLIMIATAIAVLAVPAAASANVQRNQQELTGTLTVHVGHLTDPGSESDHIYDKVTINPCDGTFVGTDGHGRWTNGGETISGQMVDGKVTSFSAAFPGGYQWTYDSTQAPTWQGFDGYQRFSVDSITFDVKPSTNYKNHGEFVKQSPDKNDAAHSCIGMPISSNR